MTACAVHGCAQVATWKAEGLTDYCSDHANEWLRAEQANTDRYDFAEECAREERHERDLEEQGSSR